MPGVRKPLTNEELAKAENEQNTRRAVAAIEDQMEGEVTKLAEAGDPDAADALAALRKALSGNTPKERLAAVSPMLEMASAAAETPQEPVSDPEDVKTAKETARTLLRQANRESRRRDRQQLTAANSQKLLDSLWRHWAQEAKRNYAKACQDFIIAIGENAVPFVKAGLFEDYLSIGAMIKQFRIQEKDGGGGGDANDDYQDFYNKMTAELRGGVMEDEEDE